MRQLSVTGHVFVFLWGAWLLGLQGFLATGALGPWTPDLGLVLLLGLGARLSREESRRAALLVALARAAFTTDAAAAVVTGYLGAVALASTLRGALEIDHVLVRGVVAAFLGGGLAAWWIACHQLALPGTPVAVGFTDVWRTALATGLAALVAAPLAYRLPGFASIRRRRR